jgi:valyl-tRNA synthetase
MHITSKDNNIDYEKLSLAEKWILSRCAHTSLLVKQGIENYKFNEAASAVYKFVWHEFCDWFIETAKPALYEKEGVQRRNCARSVLSKVLNDTVIMLHPFMPFVTEEIYSILPGTQGSVMKASYPYNKKEYEIYRNEVVEKDVEFVFDMISGIRNIRSEMKIQPSMKLKVLAHTDDKREKIIIAENKSFIVNLATLESFYFCETDSFPSSSASSVTGNTTCFVMLEGVINFDKEIARLEKEIEKNTKELLGVQKRLNNESFLDKAPDNIVKKVKDQHADLEDENNKLKENLERILKMK